MPLGGSSVEAAEALEVLHLPPGLPRHRLGRPGPRKWWRTSREVHGTPPTISMTRPLLRTPRSPNYHARSAPSGGAGEHREAVGASYHLGISSLSPPTSQAPTNTRTPPQDPWGGARLRAEGHAADLTATPETAPLSPRFGGENDECQMGLWGLILVRFFLGEGVEGVLVVEGVADVAR